MAESFQEKNLGFVICTNVTLLTSDMVKFLKKHKCEISTSLDGPKELHNMNRPLQDTTHTHEKFEEKIKMIRKVSFASFVNIEP